MLKKGNKTRCHTSTSRGSCHQTTKNFSKNKQPGTRVQNRQLNRKHEFNGFKLGRQLCTLETATSKLPQRSFGHRQCSTYRATWPTKVHPKTHGLSHKISTKHKTLNLNLTRFARVIHIVWTRELKVTYLASKEFVNLVTVASSVSKTACPAACLAAPAVASAACLPPATKLLVPRSPAQIYARRTGRSVS